MAAQQKDHLFLPYIPERLGAEIMAGDLPARHFECSGHVLLFDLCNFTQLTGRLQRSGPRGAELLQTTLTRLYSQIEQLAGDLNGSILQYAGDSALIAFEHPLEESATILPAVRKCGESILARAAGDFGQLTTDFGRMQGRVGVSSGKFQRHILGHSEAPFLLVAYTGAAIEDAVKAIADAPPGSISAIPTERPAWKQPPDLHGASAERRASQTDPEAPASGSDLIRRFIPPVLIPYLERNTEGFRGAFRSITCAFVQYRDDSNSSSAVDPIQLQNLYDVLVQEAERHGALLTQSDCSSGNQIFVFLFGAPVAVDNKELAAAMFAERLRECRLEKGLPGACRIGITTGHGYVGEVGGRTRKAFSVIGESINQAARLMNAAGPDEICLDAVTAKGARGRFVFSTRTVPLKGFEKPVEVFSLSSRATRTLLADRSSGTRVVGRRRELARLRKFLRATVRKERAFLSISGQAGVGKSRLAGSVLSQAQQDGYHIVAGECRQYETATPFSALHEPLVSLFGLDAEPENARRQLLEIVRVRFPEHLENVTLLWNLFGIAGEDTALPDGLRDLRSRRDRMFKLLMALLQWKSESAPVVLLVDDVHWADDLTMAFLVYAAGRLGPHRIGVLILSRPGPHLTWVSSIPGALSIDLEELTPEEARTLVRERLDLEHPDQEFEDRILAQVPANPFYIESIVADLKERGVFVSTGSHWAPKKDLRDIAFPVSLQDTVLARLDRLDPEEQVVIKTASVIGRIFEFELLCDIVPDQVARGRTISSLRKLHRLDLTPIETTQPLTHIFKHIVIRDVAYSSLLYSAREGLHLRLAHTLEARHWNERSEISDALARHFLAGGNLQKHLHYSALSGRKAVERLSLRDAAQHLRQALASAEKTARPGMVRKLREELGSVLRQTGEYREAIRLYNAVLPTVRNEEHRARVLAARGHAHQELGEARQALHDMETALSLLGIAVPKTRLPLFRAIGREALVQMRHRFFRRTRPAPTGALRRRLRRQLDVLLQIGKIYYMRDGERLGWIGFLTINHADRLAEPAIMSHACGTFATILISLGLTRVGGTYIERAFELGQEAGRPELAGMAWWRAAFEPMARWDPASMRHHIEQAIPPLRRSGEPWELQVSTALLGISGLLAGDLSVLRTQYRELQSLAVTYDSNLFMGWSQSILPWTAWLSGESSYSELRAGFARGLRLSRKSSDLLNQAAILAYHALIAAKEGRLGAAGLDAARAVRYLDAYKVRVPHISLCYVYAADAAHRASLAEQDPARRAALENTVSRAVRAARVQALQFPYLRPALLRFRGELALGKNRRWRATRLFRKSVALARAGASRWELALSQAALARITNNEQLFAYAQELLRSSGLHGELRALGPMGSKGPLSVATETGHP